MFWTVSLHMQTLTFARGTVCVYYICVKLAQHKFRQKNISGFLISALHHVNTTANSELVWHFTGTKEIIRGVLFQKMLSLLVKLHNIWLALFAGWWEGSSTVALVCTGILSFPSALPCYGTAVLDTNQKKKMLYSSKKGNLLVYQIVMAPANDQSVAHASPKWLCRELKAQFCFSALQAIKGAVGSTEDFEFWNRTNGYLLGNC